MKFGSDLPIEDLELIPTLVGLHVAFDKDDTTAVFALPHAITYKTNDVNICQEKPGVRSTTANWEPFVMSKTAPAPELLGN